MEKLIKLNELAIDLIYSIGHYNVLILNNKRSLAGVPGTMPNMAKRLNHEIEIYQMCINRLFNRYELCLKKQQALLGELEKNGK